MTEEDKKTEATKPTEQDPVDERDEEEEVMDPEKEARMLLNPPADSVSAFYFNYSLSLSPFLFASSSLSSSKTAMYCSLLGKWVTDHCLVLCTLLLFVFLSLCVHLSLALLWQYSISLVTCSHLLLHSKLCKNASNVTECLFFSVLSCFFICTYFFTNIASNALWWFDAVGRDIAGWLVCCVKKQQWK